MQNDRCTIQRVKKITRLDNTTLKPIETRIITEACENPLFTADEYETGVCRTCQRGWEVTGNRFASPAEMLRAQRAGVAMA